MAANSQIDADRRKINFPSEKVSGVNLLSLYSFANYLGTLNSRAKTNGVTSFFQTQQQWRRRVKLWKPQDFNIGKNFSVFLFGINTITYKIWSVKWKSERAVCGIVASLRIIPSACLMGCTGTEEVCVCCFCDWGFLEVRFCAQVRLLLHKPLTEMRRSAECVCRLQYRWSLKCLKWFPFFAAKWSI